ncbi:hypothetical protein [Nonomuraea sp. NPDC002799]
MEMGDGHHVDARGVDSASSQVGHDSGRRFDQDVIIENEPVPVSIGAVKISGSQERDLRQCRSPSFRSRKPGGLCHLDAKDPVQHRKNTPVGDLVGGPSGQAAG